MKKIHNIFNTIRNRYKVLGPIKGLYVCALEYIAKSTKNQSLQEKKHNIILNYLNSTLKINQSSFKLLDIGTGRILKSPYNIFFFWYQGDKNMPQLIKSCYNQLLKINSNNQYCIHFIDKNNLSSYVNLPDFIYKKLELGQISYTHFSDILRFALLYNYGGLWIDSTIWITRPFDINIFTFPYWSIKIKRPHYTISISHYRWTTYFFSIQKRQDPLAEKVLLYLLTYYQKENYLIDYLLLDYIIEKIIQENSIINYNMNLITDNNPQVNELNKLLNTEFKASLYSKICKDTSIFKLSYKQKLINFCNGKKTFYAMINLVNANENLY